MLSGLIARITREIRAVDEEYVDRKLPDARAAIVLATAAVCLILQRFYGRTETLFKIPGARAFFQELPHPTLYPHLYWAAFKTVGYLLIPSLVIVFVLKMRVLDFGIRGRGRSPLLLYAALAIFGVGLAYVASHSGAFLAKYPKFRAAGESFDAFLIWELAYAFQFFALEFFFRGFLLFSLARWIGSLSVFVMVVPYAMIHFDKPVLEALGSIITGAVLGILALRTRSIWGGTVVHTTVAVAMDVFALIKKGALWG